MASTPVTTREIRAVVLCEHRLLGEGLAAHLRTGGVETVVASGADDDAVGAALALHPRLVLAEHTSAECRARIAEQCPGATVLDISAVVETGRQDDADKLGFDAIWAALQTAPG